MKFIKKQGLGFWISLATILLAVIGLIIYGLALNAGNGLEIASASDPFYDWEASNYDLGLMSANVTACGILALVFLVLALVLGQFKFEGIVGKVVDFVVGALRVIVPVLFFVALLWFFYGSLSGLGWTYFSDEALIIADEAIAVGGQVITSIVFFVLAAVAGIVAAFFGLRKKEN